MQAFGLCPPLSTTKCANFRLSENVIYGIIICDKRSIFASGVFFFSVCVISLFAEAHQSHVAQAAINLAAPENLTGT